MCLSFCNDTATTEIYTYLHTLSQHDALPISTARIEKIRRDGPGGGNAGGGGGNYEPPRDEPTPYDDAEEPFRSEEHTSELQSLMRISYAVFCLKKKISYK